MKNKNIKTIIGFLLCFLMLYFTVKLFLYSLIASIIITYLGRLLADALSLFD